MNPSDTILLTWRVHPARERPITAILVTGLIAVLAWMCAQIMQQPGWGVFAFLIVGVVCNRFFFPTNYELTEQGITARFPLKTTTYQWTELRRFVFDQRGGFLSPRARKSLLDEYRGISVLFGKDAETALANIRQRLPKEAIIREVTKPAKLSQEGQTPCGG